MDRQLFQDVKINIQHLLSKDPSLSLRNLERKFREENDIHAGLVEDAYNAVMEEVKNLIPPPEEEIKDLGREVDFYLLVQGGKYVHFIERIPKKVKNVEQYWWTMHSRKRKYKKYFDRHKPQCVGVVAPETQKRQIKSLIKRNETRLIGEENDNPT